MGCSNIMTYKKVNPLEIIEVGDVLMLDPETSLITRAVVNKKGEMPINNRLVIGVCVETDNTSKIPIVIDGGSSEDSSGRVPLVKPIAPIQTIIIEGGKASQGNRDIIKIAYTGEHLVNVCGYVDLGDKLCISDHAGKAKAIEYTNRDYYRARPIGKVVKYTNSKEKVKVLLDIE